MVISISICGWRQERSNIWLSCGRNWWKTLILKNQQHFLTMYTWDVLNVNANQMNWLLNDLRRCLHHFCWGNCVERYCELANKKVERLCKVSSPCLVDHQIKQKQLVSVGDVSEFCSQIVLKCLYLARIGRPDILWSVNKFAWSVTKWTQACDRLLARLFIHSSHKWPPTMLSFG